ncbi:MAG: hypothetical protein SOX36_06750 [Candidatus Cryptobacteroides sp.]|nr:hypothetical protein [Bacteroidales bacterium]MDD7155062.1 hypothetical protein [Bacteroidales bacterium]MDY3227351.1 hypothetical protein [Candidatus Cryptobacteroides sp.]MDY5495001.1 hypothetical protein [Candidatus Cryptobacteroides sp.]
MDRIAMMAAAVALAGCTAGNIINVEVSSEVVSTDYVGNGVEWDPYDEALSWGSEVSGEDWAKLEERLDYMRPGYVRCMINSPFTYYDAAAGKYDRTRNTESLKRLLGYCQKHSVNVIFGEYNPPRWDMKGSEEWVRMSVDFLNYLVNDLGFDCIRQFVIFNEPDGNWASTDGDYDFWLSMARRFDKRMSEYPGLRDKVKLAAPDAVMNYRNPASEYDAEGWVANAAADLDGTVGIYDVHAYPGRRQVLSGDFRKSLISMKSNVPSGSRIVLGEAGYKYQGDPADSLYWNEYIRRCEGHPYTKGSDCNMLVYDYFYALDMPFLAMEAMNGGFSGIAAWMLDDAMHTNGDSGRPEDLKIWGMWNILGEEVFGDASQEEIRPWYYTWSLICRYFPSGSSILKVVSDECCGFTAAAAVKDGKMSVALVNCNEEQLNVNLNLPRALENAVMFSFNRPGKVSESVAPSNGCLKMSVPAESLILLTEMEND